MLAYQAATTTTAKVDMQLEVVEEDIYKISDRERKPGDYLEETGATTRTIRTTRTARRTSKSLN
jgi:hypothetical protein